MIELPERNEAAKFATSVFFEDFNDIDVYVEDTANGYEKIFSILLARLLAPKLTVTKVFGLGERNKVIEAATLYPDQRRKAVFLIDGDLYLLCGEQIQLPPNIISLDRYCIENFLLDEDSLLDIMDDEDPTKGIEELRNIFKFNEWRGNSAALFRKLFIIYGVAHSLKSGEPTTSRKMNEIVQNNLGDIDVGKIDALCLLIKNNLSLKFGIDVVEDEIRRITLALDEKECFVCKYVSAKSYILPILFLRMRSLTKLSSNNLTIKMRLAKRCTLEPLKKTKEEIFSLAGA